MALSSGSITWFYAQADVVVYDLHELMMVVRTRVATHDIY
ncbi:hypothetical protein ERO13_A05G300132v2 [Gossypium hirsutum]|nr:hypothetical protein ERO13_A05G300132v2 [Gossypium hirsutum]